MINVTEIRAFNDGCKRFKSTVEIYFASDLNKTMYVLSICFSWYDYTWCTVIYPVFSSSADSQSGLSQKNQPPTSKLPGYQTCLKTKLVTQILRTRI